MQYSFLGRTGLRVSRLCLGTMNFGSLTSQEDSFAILDRALDSGINFVDTANVYGGRAGKGATEELLGKWLAQGGRRRESVVLATKVYGRMYDGENQSKLSAYHIRAACEESLRRLHTDHIDLYQMHHVDRDTPWDEIWQAMEQLVREGKVLYVGSSNFAAWNIAQANGVANQRHFLGLVSEQSLYNLAARMVELEVIPACRGLGLSLLPWSPLNGGMLGGVLENADGRRGTEIVRKRIDAHRTALGKYEEFCKDLGHPPGDVALAWLLANDAVAAPIVGPRTMQHLDDALRALAVTLPPEALEALDLIWPGPGGQAPEAYAW
ncbi:MAG: aldo/keto reductase [Candidatus Eisenbacteria bacterium]|uniref:Aldo/keto reductase n=1 Tax=Eiseniibacteriota bacterium TaxID=2212470 RepID=A0A956NHH5_UNCEI|nr:aldo/keto reductase [Candidatus Eisenbacteria bacterium]MCB9463880.1 aldo/keto reductase [Candidatus Eisenbacteria bacterium]